MSRELEEALRELALEIAQCYATIEQQKAVMRQALEVLEHHTEIRHPQQIRYRDRAIDALREELKEKI